MDPERDVEAGRDQVRNETTGAIQRRRPLVWKMHGLSLLVGAGPSDGRRRTNGTHETLLRLADAP